MSARQVNERGMVSTELAILMPVMVVLSLLAVFVVHAGRHSSRAQQAADAAARAASLTLDEAEAGAAALRAAQEVCTGTIDTIDVDFDGARPADFRPGSVSVRISCTERFSAFAPLFGDETRTEVAVAVSVIEYWRPGENLPAP